MSDLNEFLDLVGTEPKVRTDSLGPCWFCGEPVYPEQDQIWMVVHEDDDPKDYVISHLTCLYALKRKLGLPEDV